MKKCCESNTANVIKLIFLSILDTNIKLKTSQLNTS